MKTTLTVSEVNLKAIFPQSCGEKFSALEYRKKDELNNGAPTVTWWVGKSADDCESRYEVTFKRQQSGKVAIRSKAFEIPGVPFRFMIVNDQIYYRKNVE